MARLVSARNKVAPEDTGGEELIAFAEEQQGGEKREGEVKPRTAKRFFRYSNSWKRTNSNANGNSTSNGTGDSEAVDAPVARDDPSLSLLKYFSQLADNEVEEIDFAHMERLITVGASITATSDESGQCVMHTVAASWAVTVAEFLLEKGADVHSRDACGRTPLHVAATTDHAEMVQCLLRHGAELDCCTHPEEQTAIHYATRNDSLHALKVLIEQGGNLEARDYQGRTPLQLAAEFDRTAAVEYLLGLETPAECKVCDDVGNPALVSMIRTMPKVALVALDQLHKLAPADRKQYFLLSHLEPEPAYHSRGVKTPFEIAVEERRYDVLTHPVMKELIHQKWKLFVRYHFYLYLFLYIIFLLSWTILIAYPSLQEKHKYVFPRDIWRIFLELLAVGTYLHQIAEEVLELYRSRSKHAQYKRVRVRALQDDLEQVDGSLPEERKYIENNLHRANKSPPAYFKDPWNIVDIVTYVVLLVVMVMHAADVGVHSERLALWTARMSCVAVILVWVRLLKHARGFTSIGPLIAIIGEIIGDIVKYFIIFAIFYVPYVICFWVLFGGEQSSGEEDKSDLTTFHRVLIMLFRMSVVDDYPYATLRRIDELMSAVLVITYLLLVAVIGLNLFIALLSDTFQRVYDNAQANAEMQQARIILSLEEKASRCWRERYLRHIHTNCNPCARYYDDDEDRRDEAPSKLQKVTHQIHAIVSSLRQDIDEEEGGKKQAVNDMDGVTNGLEAKLEQQDQKMLRISQHLAEIKNVLFAMQGRDQESLTAVRTSPILEEVEEGRLTPENAPHVPEHDYSPARHPRGVDTASVGSPYERSMSQAPQSQTTLRLFTQTSLPSPSMASPGGRSNVGSQSSRSSSRVLLEQQSSSRNEYTVTNHRRVKKKNTTDFREQQWAVKMAGKRK